MKRILYILMLLPAIASAQTKAQRYIDSLMTTEPFRTARLGVLAVTASGQTVAEYGSIYKMVPASNTKLITTGLALTELGKDYRFKTSIGYSGEIVDGTLTGDVYIIGGGDPTLASRDSIAHGIESIFGLWKSMLTTAGIRRINGRIIGDGRWADGDDELSSWLYEDIGTYYGTGTSGLNFYRNKKDFRVSAGASPGDALSIEQGYPDTPWMSYDYRCSTGKAGTGDLLFLYTNDIMPYGEIRGTFASDRKPKTVECSNKFPEMTCAREFYKYLKSSGMPCSGYGDVTEAGLLRTDFSRKSVETAADAPRIIGQTTSPAVSRIAYMVNQRSDNMYAEALLRAISKKSTGSACYDSCAVAEYAALTRLGLDTSSGVDIVDGSGLSRRNCISPEFFCKFLRTMLYSPSCEAFVSTLTTPGKGSQVGRLRQEPAEIRDRVFYKSGSMGGVRCFSGYVVPTDGGKEDTIIFSVMLNNFSGQSWIAMSRIDRIIALIANEN